MTNTTDGDYGGVQNGKVAAVEEWQWALDDLPPTAWAKTLRNADIHDLEGRMEIVEVIEHEASDEHYLPLHDAFDSIKTEFGY